MIRALQSYKCEVRRDEAAGKAYHNSCRIWSQSNNNDKCDQSNEKGAGFNSQVLGDEEQILIVIKVFEFEFLDYFCKINAHGKDFVFKNQIIMGKEMKSLNLDCSEKR